MTEKIEILFVDDNERLRKSISDELEEHNIFTIATALNGQECLDKLKIIKPHVVVLDLEMPVMDGNEAFNHIKKNYPEMRVLILSSYYEEGMIDNYIHRGVKGYLPKKFIATNADILAMGIRAIHNSETFYYSYDPTSSIKYTKRETEIIPLLVCCKTSKEIGHELGIDEKRVNKFRDQLHRKTNSRNAPEFIKYCIEGGLKYLGKK
jgi:DNA-binding NarL/FixJ family response regulator